VRKTLTVATNSAIDTRRSPTMKTLLKLVLSITLLVSANNAPAAGKPKSEPRDAGQIPAKAGTERYGCSEKDIARYVCRRAAGPLKIDGLLNEPSWQMAEKSPRFVDMVTGEPGFYDTRAAALWDDEYFY